jgi:hypothetical protein
MRSISLCGQTYSLCVNVLQIKLLQNDVVLEHLFLSQANHLVAPLPPVTNLQLQNLIFIYK